MKFWGGDFEYDIPAYTNPFQVLTFLQIKTSQSEMQKQRQVDADVLKQVM